MAKTISTKAAEALLTALACGATVENAARKAGIGERTAYRRLADPEFRKQLNQACLEIALRTSRMLSGSGMASVKTLVDLQQDVSVPPAVRRGAARDVLDMAIKYRESMSLDQRVAALEDQLASQDKDQDTP